MRAYDNLRGVSYCEMLLTCGGGANPRTEVYFSNGLNIEDNPMDTCGNFTDVDPASIKAQYSVQNVFKNGPRGWTLDWLEVPVGVTRDFDGFDAIWESELQADPSASSSAAYASLTVKRDSKVLFRAGQPLFILDDPDGTPWVMKSWSNIVDPSLAYANLNTLGGKLKLPPGWSFRVEIAKDDLTISAVDGTARITQDELQNTYDACFKSNNQAACSYQPVAK